MATLKDFADILGVGLKEEFIINNSTSIYRITNDRFEVKSSCCDKWYEVSNGNIMYELLKYDNEITILPHKPNFNEAYYYVRPDGAIKWQSWGGDTFDCMAFALGNCFATKEKAEQNKHEIVQKLQVYNE